MEKSILLGPLRPRRRDMLGKSYRKRACYSTIDLSVAILYNYLRILWGLAQLVRASVGCVQALKAEGCTFESCTPYKILSRCFFSGLAQLVEHQLSRLEVVRSSRTPAATLHFIVLWCRSSIGRALDFNRAVGGSSPSVTTKSLHFNSFFSGVAQSGKSTCLVSTGSKVQFLSPLPFTGIAKHGLRHRSTWPDIAGSNPVTRATHRSFHSFRGVA